MLKAKRSSPLGGFNVSWFKNVKFWGLFVFAIILLGLPVALFEVQQQQNSQQHAQFLNGSQQYYCNSNLTVLVAPASGNAPEPQPELPAACTNGAYSGVTSYQSAVTVKAKSGSKGTYTVHWMWAQFFCTKAATSPCLDNPTSTSNTAPLTGDGSKYVIAQSNAKAPPASYAGQACGVYQNDFGFFVTDNSDTSQKHLCTSVVLTTNGLGVVNNNASWCKASKDCTTIPSITPTLSPTTPPSVTPTVTDTPTDTPSPTASPSATPTDTPPATPTVTPTGTLTPTLSPTATPTGAPTDTPIPGTSPTPTIIVARPTLPPTGPSNTIMAVGLVGIAISVLGIALLIGI